LRETLWRQGFQCGELSRHDANERIHSLHSANCAERIVLFQSRYECPQLMQDQLEPQLTSLMNYDEQQLIRMLGRRL